MSFFKNIIISAESLSTNGKFILVTLLANTVYRDGRATQETDGYKASVVSIPNFDKLTVKVPGKDPPDLTKDSILKRNSTGNFCFVSFSNLVGKMWQDHSTKEVKISATADDMQVLETDVNNIDIFNGKE